MNRTTLSLTAAVAGLLALTGVAALQAPSGEGGDSAPASARLPVERSTLLCPQPSSSDLAETEYTAFTPETDAGGQRGPKRSADLLPAPPVPVDSGRGGERREREADRQRTERPVISLRKPGTPATTRVNTAEAPALAGSAEGPLAPGWTVQQTTMVSNGSGRGLLGTACTAPDTEFWFPGGSLAPSRQDYIHLTNPDRTPAVVDLELHGRNGEIAGARGEEITVPGQASVPVLLSTLTSQRVVNATVHVKARTGRVGAQLQAADDLLGSDWLPATADPAPQVVLPGIPADATSVRLVLFAPGGRDADLRVRLAGASSTITPAGYETLHVKSRTTTAVDLRDLTRGEPGSLLLSPAEGTGDPTDVVAALRVTRGKGAGQELAYIPGTAPIEERATAADNRAQGSRLSLVAPGKSVRVKVTASAGSEGGRPVSATYTVKGGTTMAVRPPVPDGLKGRFGLTVERVSGGPLHAARTLVLPQGRIPMFTVQALADDRGMVEVPHAEQDLSVLLKD